MPVLHEMMWLALVSLGLVHHRGVGMTPGTAMGTPCGMASRGTMDTGSSNGYTMGTTMGRTFLG